MTLAREQNLFLMEAVWSRFLPACSGPSTSPLPENSATCTGSPPIWVSPRPTPPPPRLWARQDGGGALLDISVYPLLWALGTLGFPQTVSATGVVNDDGVDAQNALTLGYHHGAQAQLTSSLLAHGPRTATVAGSLGYLQSVGSINNPANCVVGIGRGTSRRTEHVRRRRAGATPTSSAR